MQTGAIVLNVPVLCYMNDGAGSNSVSNGSFV